MAFSPGNLSASSSASSTLGSPESEEHILSFETVDKMRRVSSYSALNSLIGEPPAPAASPSLELVTQAASSRGTFRNLPPLHQSPEQRSRRGPAPGHSPCS